MSEASRAAALAHAATVHHGSSATAEQVLEAAEAFHAFIAGPGAEAPATPVKAKAAAKPVAPAKPVKAAKAAPPPEDDDAGDEDETEAEGDVTKDQVGEAIEALLNANLRNQALKLFAKYKAKSLSGVKPEDYAAVKQEAEDLLLSA